MEVVAAIQVKIGGLGQSASTGGGEKWLLGSECILKVELASFSHDSKVLAKITERKVVLSRYAVGYTRQDSRTEV